MTRLLWRVRHELGPAGIGALVLLALGAAFSLLVLQPLQERGRAVESALARAQPGGAASAAGRLGELYRFLDKPEQTTDWLAKLHGAARATGIELGSASYRSHSPGGRLERYEIVLPVSASYAQIRAFLSRALAEIPVLSIDQVSLKRESRNQGAVQAELRLTLHRLKP